MVSDGQEPNKSLQITIDEILKWFIEVSPSIDVFGRYIRISLDQVAFFRDFVYIASVSDNMRQSASAFCIHCSIRKNKNPVASRYMFFNISDTFNKTMVRSISLAEESMKCLIVALSTKLREERSDIRNNCRGKKIVSGFSDASLCTKVGLANLLKPVITTLLHTAFSKIATAKSPKPPQL